MKRNQGLDLLRILLVFMVCVLHTLGRGGVLEACAVSSVSYKVYWFIEICCYCAVDGFAILSGFVANDKPQKYEKLIGMWFQAFFYSFVITAVCTLCKIKVYPVSTLVRLAFPVTINIFWYFTAFFVLFFFKPIINKWVFGISKKTAFFAILITIALGGIECIEGAFKTNNGYSVIWLIALYIVGACAKRCGIFSHIKTVWLWLMLVLSNVFTFIALLFCGDETVVSYTFPTVVFCGILLVIIFSRLEIKSKIIGFVSPLTFGIYLCQMTPVFWEHLNGRTAFVYGMGAIGLLYAFAFAVAIFILCGVVEFVRQKLFRLIGIPKLSQFISEKCK